MGNLSSIIKRLSCNCASDCSLSDETKQLHKFIKKMAVEDLREIRDYFLEREEIINENRKKLREEFRRSVKQSSIII